MTTPVTPILIEAPTVASLQDAGYAVLVNSISAETLGTTDDGPSDREIAAWEPGKPDGDGWILHHKGMSEDGDIVFAVWAHPLPSFDDDLAARRSPRPYRLHDPAERARLLHETVGYAKTSLYAKDGTDWEVRRYAWTALASAMIAGFILSPKASE